MASWCFAFYSFGNGRAMIQRLFSVWSKWLKEKEFLDVKHLINLTCSYISLPVKFKGTGTEQKQLAFPSLLLAPDSSIGLSVTFSLLLHPARNWL